MKYVFGDECVHTNACVYIHSFLRFKYTTPGVYVTIYTRYREDMESVKDLLKWESKKIKLFIEGVKAIITNLFLI